MYLVIFGVPETTSRRASPPLGLDASVRDSALEPGDSDSDKGGSNYVSKPQEVVWLTNGKMFTLL